MATRVRGGACSCDHPGQIRPARTASTARSRTGCVIRMEILVMGGIALPGREVVRAALAQGHDVTALARGESGSVPSSVRFARADRSAADAYTEVAGRDWDVVVDVARQPGHVRGALGALGDRSRSWVFVS